MAAFKRQDFNTLLFIARVACGELRREIQTDDEIAEPMWLSREELKQRETQFRNPVTKKCLADYFSGTRYPLAAVQITRLLKCWSFFREEFGPTARL
jgi:hypothetical protein